MCEPSACKRPEEGKTTGEGENTTEETASGNELPPDSKQTETPSNANNAGNGEKSNSSVVTIDEVTVTFDVRGGQDGPEPVTVACGSGIDLPKEPIKSGYTFAGWETEAGKAWVFHNPAGSGNGASVNCDMTLYAVWCLNGSGEGSGYEISGGKKPQTGGSSGSGANQGPGMKLKQESGETQCKTLPEELVDLEENPSGPENDNSEKRVLEPVSNNKEKEGLPETGDKGMGGVWVLLSGGCLSGIWFVVLLTNKRKIK